MVGAAAVVVRDVVMPEQRKMTPLSVRIPVDLAKRIDRLLPKVTKKSAFSGLAVVTRSSIVQLALLKGIEQLEKEF